MTITVEYTSKKYTKNPNAPVTRYVRAKYAGIYAWCERDNEDWRYDLRQGICGASDLPDDVRAAADAKIGQAFSYVEWPLVSKDNPKR